MPVVRTAVTRSTGSQSKRFAAAGGADPRTRKRQQDPLSAAGSRDHSTARSLSATGAAGPRRHRFVCFPQRAGSRCPDDTCGVVLTVSLPSPDHRRHARQPASVSTHVCLGYGASRRQPARAHAVDGTRQHSDHPNLCTDTPLEVYQQYARAVAQHIRPLPVTPS